MMTETEVIRQHITGLETKLNDCYAQVNMLRAQVNGIRDWQRPVESNIARLAARHDAVGHRGSVTVHKV